MQKIKGAFPVLITPMDEFQEIDWQGVKQNVNYFIEQKVVELLLMEVRGNLLVYQKKNDLTW